MALIVTGCVVRFDLRDGRRSNRSVQASAPATEIETYLTPVRSGVQNIQGEFSITLAFDLLRID